MDKKTRMARWRLVLGKGAEDVTGGLSGEWAEREKALGFLYDREYGAGRNQRGRGDGQGADDNQRGGTGDSVLSVPDWINQVHDLFPKRVIERIEKDALERYKLEEMVTNPDLLRRAEPSQTLLKAILRTKHLMNEEVLALARQLVKRQIEALMKQLAREIQTPFGGAINRQQRSFVKIAKNFDAPTTIRRNLAHYDPQTRRMYIRTPYFNSRVRRQSDKWQVIIVVDQSGSMANSVIHAAVTASIFWGVKSLRTHLVVFDTNVVDLTDDCTDPVETLMKVNLGGGTDIGRALTYAETLVENPRRTILVLITDFYEGGSRDTLYSVSKRLIDSGVKYLGLAALDRNANPGYDRNIAGDIAAMGAHVGAMTPGELAEFVAGIVK